MSGCWKKFLWVGGWWYNSRIESLQVLSTLDFGLGLWLGLWQNFIVSWILIDFDSASVEVWSDTSAPGLHWPDEHQSELQVQQQCDRGEQDSSSVSGVRSPGLFSESLLWDSDQWSQVWRMHCSRQTLWCWCRHLLEDQRVPHLHHQQDHQRCLSTSSLSWRVRGDWQGAQERKPSVSWWREIWRTQQVYYEPLCKQIRLFSMSGCGWRMRCQRRLRDSLIQNSLSTLTGKLCS